MFGHLSNQSSRFVWKGLSLSHVNDDGPRGLCVTRRNKTQAQLRRNVHLRDTIEHRKQALYLALAAEDWRDILADENISVAVGLMEDKIRTLMDECIPLKTVRISPRDPTSPLVRSMLIVTSKISVSNQSDFQK